MIKLTAIKPKKFNSDIFVKEFAIEAEAVSREQQSDFELTTANWKTKVKFERTVSVKPRVVIIFVGTDNQIYAYVSDGTKGHFVAPVRAKALRFPTVYTAKTMPGVLRSSGGGPSGGFAFSKGHFVRGIKPRKFDLTMKRNWDKKFQHRMERAMTRAIKGCNHAM